jgi:hypothetical protein
VVVAGDGGLSPPSLSDGDRLLWWLSNDEEGTNHAMDLGEASGTVGLAREVAHQHGGELGWWLGLGQDFMKSRITTAQFIGGK